MFFKNKCFRPWPGGLPVRACPDTPRLRAWSWSGHVQEPTYECVNEWHSTLMSLSCPFMSFSKVDKFIFLKTRIVHTC